MHELNGTVKEIFDEVTFPSGFNKREFVVTDENENYPQDIKFECVKRRLTSIPLKRDQVKVSFNHGATSTMGSTMSIWPHGRSNRQNRLTPQPIQYPILIPLMKF